MTFAGIVKNSLVDYPGLISCVLFVPCCNYDCFFCHNRLLIGDKAPALEERAVWDFLRKRAGLIDAVVVSGGEPTLQGDLADTIEAIKKIGYSVKLDTNGSRPDVVSSLISNGLCDYVAVDYKAPAARYAEVCGKAADPSRVRETIGLLLDNGIRFEVRTTVLPQLGEEDLLKMAQELPAVPRYVLNRYRPPEQYKLCDRARIAQTPYTEKEIDAFARAMRAYQPNMVLHSS